jgi:hypothetical protein
MKREVILKVKKSRFYVGLHINLCVVGMNKSEKKKIKNGRLRRER